MHIHGFDIKTQTYAVSDGDERRYMTAQQVQTKYGINPFFELQKQYDDRKVEKKK